MSTQPDYRELYSDVMPSVVSIYVDVPVEDARGRGAGSGFVCDDDGHLVTNQHVVASPRGGRGGRARGVEPPADEVSVRFDRGAWRTAEVVGTDVHTDLAVVRVDDPPDDARPLPVAASSPDPGTPVAALGNPMGLDGSITGGIVSGTNRSMPTGSGFVLPDTVQTDAAINPGNSGGPLVARAGDGSSLVPDDARDSHDGTGESPRDAGESPGEASEAPGDAGAIVVGVNRARQGDNIGFAVSPEIVERVVPSLVADGRHRHPYLNVRTLDVTPVVAEANDLDEVRGILVVDVRLGPSSGALREPTGSVEVRGREVPVGGDVVVAIDGEPVDAHEELMRRLVVERSPGDRVDLTVVRGGDRRTVEVELAERPLPGRSVPVE